MKLSADEVKDLKKVAKVAPTTAAERLKKLNPKAELPPPGGQASGESDDKAKLQGQLQDQATVLAEKFPDVCEKCGAPSGPEGCSLAIPNADDSAGKTECEILAAMLDAARNG